VKFGLIRPRHNDFGSPILFVREADGSLRVYIDYRGLNEVARKGAHSLPRVDDTIDELKAANFTPISTSRVAYGKFEFVRRTSIKSVSDKLWYDGVGRHAIRTVQCLSYV
jgi:hypothetical protein